MKFRQLGFPPRFGSLGGGASLALLNKQRGSKVPKIQKIVFIFFLC